MKKIVLILATLLVSVSVYSQKIGIKNNLIYDATLTPNLGVELGLGKRTTLEIGGGYNPFTFDNGKSFKHWMVQPEFRYWNCERFNGLFFGLHGHGGEFDAGGIDLPFGIFPDFKDYHYDGHFYGGGISIGYQWLLGKRWNIEASVGGGYARVDYKKYYCADCSPLLEDSTYDYWGLTRATLSIIFFIY